MIYVVPLLLLLFVAVAPQLWVRWVLRRHSRERPDLPLSGAEFARRLLEGCGLERVAVEEIAVGSHYDPEALAVRLEPRFFRHSSVAALAVAAHEVGHAIQHREGYVWFRRRAFLVRFALLAQRFGAWAIVAAPIIGLTSRAPLATLLALLAGFCFFGVAILVHLVTLPVEFDASWKRARPFLARILSQRDLSAAIHVLRACALTYVASSLIALFNISRWWALLRR